MSGAGGLDWEFGTSRYKLLYIVWINNKVLLYSTRNYTQYPIINHNGKEFFRRLKAFGLSVKEDKKTSYRLGEKYLQPPYLTKNCYLEYIENTQNSTVKNQIFQLENGHKI